MTTAEAAAKVGLAPSTLLARARVLGLELPTTRTGKRGRPGLRWTLKAARAVARGLRG